MANWVEFTISLADDVSWERIEHGTPDLTGIQGLDMHVDTWGAGFGVWIDGVSRELQPGSGVPGTEASVPIFLAVSASALIPVCGTTAMRLDLPSASKVAWLSLRLGGGAYGRSWRGRCLRVRRY